MSVKITDDVLNAALQRLQIYFMALRVTASGDIVAPDPNAYPLTQLYSNDQIVRMFNDYYRGRLLQYMQNGGSPEDYYLRYISDPEVKSGLMMLVKYNKLTSIKNVIRTVLSAYSQRHPNSGAAEWFNRTIDSANVRSVSPMDKITYLNLGKIITRTPIGTLVLQCKFMDINTYITTPSKVQDILNTVESAITSMGNVFLDYETIAKRILFDIAITTMAPSTIKYLTDSDRIQLTEWYSDILRDKYKGTTLSQNQMDSDALRTMNIPDIQSSITAKIKINIDNYRTVADYYVILYSSENDIFSLCYTTETDLKDNLFISDTKVDLQLDDLMFIVANSDTGVAMRLGRSQDDINTLTESDYVKHHDMIRAVLSSIYDPTYYAALIMAHMTIETRNARRSTLTKVLYEATSPSSGLYSYLINWIYNYIKPFMDTMSIPITNDEADGLFNRMMLSMDYHAFLRSYHVYCRNAMADYLITIFYRNYMNDPDKINTVKRIRSMTVESPEWYVYQDHLQGLRNLVLNLTGLARVNNINDIANTIHEIDMQGIEADVFHDQRTMDTVWDYIMDVISLMDVSKQSPSQMGKFGR